MSQNGRRRNDSGHGSRGIGAFAAIGLGDPGLVGEWMWLSNKYRPPLVRPDGAKVAPIGVGREGAGPIAAPLWRSGNAPLDGVSGELADTSGAGTETFLGRNDFRPEFNLPRLSGAEGTLPIRRAGDGTFDILAYGFPSSVITFSSTSMVEPSSASDAIEAFLRLRCTADG